MVNRLLTDLLINKNLKLKRKTIMKKYFAFFVAFAMPLISNAQITTDSYGNVKIKRTESSTYTMLGIGSQYNNAEYASYQMGTHARVSNVGIYDVGVYGYATPANPGNSGRSIGICGIGGNSTSGYNYGVLGGLTNTQRSGAGIFGTILNHIGVNVSGLYAGYFDGATRVAGTLTATSIVSPSDIRLKENIISLCDERSSALANILDMNVISYNYKFQESEVNDTAQVVHPEIEKIRAAEAAVRHFGLSAQELQTIYPNLVYEGQDGYLSVNYIELVPVLIRSIQELQQEIESLKMYQRIGTTDIEDIDQMEAKLFQNNPNPFSQQTIIKFHIPENTLNSCIYIFDMQGKMQKQYPVTTAQNSITIDSYELPAGLYLYSLVINGKEVATKRMILSN